MSPELPISATRRIRIVVIDDSREILQLLEEALSDAGYLVVCLPGDTPISAIGVQAPSLVLADPGFPSPEALSMLRAMRSFNALKATPLLAVTGDVDLLREHRAELRMLQVRTIAKPFAIAELLSRVESLVAEADPRRA